MKRHLHTGLLLMLMQLLSAQQADTAFVPASKEDSSKVRITRLKINSAQSDFSPYVLNKQLLFVSGRNRDVGVQYVDANNTSEITDIYSCSIKNPVSFRNVGGFSAEINTKYHEGPFCFNRKGDVIYYTANDKKTDLLKIYRSQKINGRWTKPEPMPFCEQAFSYCHPALSPDERSMVFAAGIEKEKKGMDLYISRFVDSSWTKPVALENGVNDSTNQVFPFISASNVLYFSTKKRDGIGGLDVYYVAMDSDSAIVRPFPYINSPYDDFGVWVDSAAASGYFSSNRGHEGDDIYHFAQGMPDFSDARRVVTKTSFCFSFFEESTLASKDTVNLTYEWSFGDGAKGRGLKTRHCFPGPGNYKVELNIVDKESGEVFTSQASYPLTIEPPDQLVISCSGSAAPGKELGFSSSECRIKGYELDKIYWSFGDGKYNSGKNVRHAYAKPGEYIVEAGLLAKSLESGKTEQFKVEKKITVINPTYEK